MPVTVARSRFSWSRDHRQQPHVSPNSQHLSRVLYSWALVLLESVRQLKDSKPKSFPADIPARQLQNLNLAEVWVSATGEFQLEKVSCMQSYQPRLLRVLQICQSYTMPWAHRPALPYTSTAASLPTTKCHNLGLQQRLHHCTFDQHRSGFGPAALTITKFYPKCGYAGTAQTKKCSEEDKLCLCLSLTLQHHEASCKVVAADKHWHWAHD